MLAPMEAPIVAARRLLAGAFFADVSERLRRRLGADAAAAACDSAAAAVGAAEDLAACLALYDASNALARSPPADCSRLRWVVRDFLGLAALDSVLFSAGAAFGPALEAADAPLELLAASRAAAASPRAAAAVLDVRTVVEGGPLDPGAGSLARAARRVWLFLLECAADELDFALAAAALVAYHSAWPLELWPASPPAADRRPGEYFMHLLWAAADAVPPDAEQRQPLCKARAFRALGLTNQPPDGWAPPEPATALGAFCAHRGYRAAAALYGIELAP
jgi:hypothetical protein